MVRRRVASEKCSMAVGLRQCIRPRVESVTPGHDGCPLAFVLMRLDGLDALPFPRSGFKKRQERPIAISIFRQQTCSRNSFSLTGILIVSSPFPGAPIAFVLRIRRPRPCENKFVGQSHDDKHSGACAPAVAQATRSDQAPLLVPLLQYRCVRPERRVFVNTYCPVY